MRMRLAVLVFEMRRCSKEKHRVKHTSEKIGRPPLDNCVRPVSHISASVTSPWEVKESCEIRHSQRREFNEEQRGRFLTALCGGVVVI
jgi:hypothetical protein